MRRIYYEMRGDEFECVGASNDNAGSEIEFSFKDSLIGAIALAGSIKKIDGKSCVFKADDICDGVFSPVLYKDGKPIHLEAFVIEDGKIRLMPKSDAYIRKLSARVELLFRELTDIKSSLSAISAKVNGKTIF